jgi:hypothetical protein
MDETLRLLHSGWHGRLCLTRAGRRGQRSVNHVWKPVVSSLWAISGPPLSDTWHRAAPEALHAHASLSVRRLRVASVVQSRRVRAASVAAHAPAGPLTGRAVRLRSRAVRRATARPRRGVPDIWRRDPHSHGRGIGADVRARPTRHPSSGDQRVPPAAPAARQRRPQQPYQKHDNSQKDHRGKQAPADHVAGRHRDRRRSDWRLTRQGGPADRAGFYPRDDGLRAGRTAYVPARDVHGGRASARARSRASARTQCTRQAAFESAAPYGHRVK